MFSQNLKQLIALTGYTNQFLTTGKEPVSSILKEFILSSADSILFKEKSDTQAETGYKTIAQEPTEWMNYLKEGGCERVKLLYQHHQKDSDRNSFRRETLWYLEAHYPDGCDIWVGRWDRDPDKAGHFLVSYLLIYQRQEPKPIDRPVSVLKEVLEDRLNILINFTLTMDLKEWCDYFEKAQMHLVEDPGSSPKASSTSLPVSFYPLPNRQLLKTAEEAWVFHDEKGWGALHFGDYPSQKTYLQLTNDLYDDLCLCISNAVNCFERGGEKK